MAAPRVDVPEVSLTPRQRQVFDLLADGWTDGEMGEELGISARTARMHVDALRVKFGVSQRRRLLAIHQALTSPVSAAAFTSDVSL